MDELSQRALEALEDADAASDRRAIELFILGGPVQPDTLRAIAKLALANAILLKILTAAAVNPLDPSGRPWSA